MKPIKLIMEGFGPYLNKTEIDFKSLGDGLTLITGNTGAGKTTIFDAICCALYGETSGKARSFKQMRTEGAPAKVDTKVTFEFELKGKHYLIERSPSYERKKQKGEGTTTVGGKATLYYPDGRVVTKSNTVDAEIKELLGIEKEEFRQIVMIAQNDFMAMLAETSGNQERIFNRIFDTRLYKKFAENVNKEHEKVKTRLGGIQDKIRDAVIETGLSDVLTDYIEPEQVLVALKDQALSFRNSLPEMKETLEKAKEAYRKKLREEEQAKGLSEAFKKLREKGLEKKALEEKKKEIEQTEQKITRAETARDEVEPVYRSYKQEEETFKLTQEKIQDIDKQTKQAGQKEQEAKEGLKDYPEELYSRLSRNCYQLNEDLPEYEVLNGLQEEYKKLKETENSQKREVDQLQERLNKDQLELDSIETKDKGFYTGERLRIEAEQRQLEDLTDTYNKCKATIEKLRTDVDQYIRASEKYTQTYADYKTAENRSTDAFHNYIENQAYFLAKNLKEDEPCPVCGSHSHPHPADMVSQTVVTKEDVDHLEAATKSLKEQLESIEKKQNKVLVDIRGGYIALNSNSEKLRRVDSVIKKEGLDVTTYLKRLELLMKAPEKLENREREKQSLNSLYRTCQSILQYLDRQNQKVQSELLVLDKEETDNALKLEQKSQLEKRIEESDKKLQTLKQSLQKSTIEVEKKGTQIKEKQKHLSFDTLDKAKEALKEQQEKMQTFEREKQKLQEEETKWSKILNQLQGTAQTLVVEKNEAKQRFSEYGEQLAEKLKACHFADQEDFLKSLKVLENVSTLRTEVADYYKEIHLINKEYESLEKETRDHVEPDLKQFKDQVEQAQKEAEEAQAAVIERDHQIQEIEKTRKRVVNWNKELGKDSKRADVLNDLYKTVNKKGRTFSQYVLSVYFRKVLAKANLKLAEMTNGVYELRQHPEKQLEIEVYDATSGTTRNVKTLSGGETFMASLSLALGFSEVVEEQNGGVRLDTIFIDEGFGSLDPENLERAVDVLSKLSQERRVAIISHVEQLKERIPQQIIINKAHDTSSIKIKTL